MTERERTVPLHCWLCMKQLVARKASSVRARVCVCMHACAQLCLTLCDAIDGSPLGSAVPGILQARTLERVAISFSNALE